MPQVNFFDFINARLKKEGINNGKPLNRFQLDVLQDPSRFKVIVWHRKAGKTLTALIETFRQSQLRIGTYWLVFPFLDEGRDTVWQSMLQKVIPEEFILNRNKNYMSLELTNGSYIRVKGSDHPEALRGPNVCGIVCDEFSRMRPETWGILSPMIQATTGWAWFISTPAGKNHLYDFYNRGPSKNKDFKEWKSWYLTVLESGVMTQDEMDAEYANIGPEQYSQEYLCAWLEGAGQVFRGVDKILTAVEEGPREGHLYVVGCDIAKLQDWTVITVFDRENNMQVFQDRFQRIDWPLVKRRIAEVSKLYNGAIVSLDATGIGDSMHDELMYMGVPVNPVKFTEPEKRFMVDKLQTWIQNQWLSLLPRKDTTDELGDYAYKKGMTGRYTYSAPSGRHDDIVCLTIGSLILTDKGQIPIEKIKIGDLVMTRKGYKPVIKTGHRLKEVINNLGLRGTPDHPVILANGKVKPLQFVRLNDIIHVWNQQKQKIEKLSYIEVKSIIDTQNQKDGILESIFGDMINGRLRQLLYIVKNGLIISERYRKDILSTIKTIIHSIMNLQIYNAYPVVNIIDIIQDSELQRKQQSVPISFVTKNLNTQILCERLSSAPIYAGKEIEMVYNLQISECPEYFANNILVHNCSLMLAVKELNPVMTKQKIATEPNWLQLHKQRAIQNMHGNDNEYWEQLAEWERL